MANAPDEMTRTPARRPAPDISKIEDPAAIREEISRTRAQMGRTLNEIQWQLSPDYIREQTQEAIREATVEKVETMARRAEYKVNNWRNNAMQTVRDNPVPAAIAALGLGWLIVSGRQEDDEWDFDYEYTDYGDYGDYRRRGTRSRYGRTDANEPRSTARYRYPLSSDYDTYDDFGYDPDDLRSAYPADAGRRPGTVTRGTGAPDEGTTNQPSAEQIRRAAAETGAWAGNRAADARDWAEEHAEEAGEWAGEITDETRERLHDTADSVRQSAQHMRESAGETWSHAGESAAETAEMARRRAMAARREMEREMRQVKRSFWNTMEDNPLAVGIAALAAGALVGLALPGTQRENEMIGPTRDSLVEDVTSTVRETARKAQTVVTETAQTAMDEAKKEAKQQAKKEDLTLSS